MKPLAVPTITVWAGLLLLAVLLRLLAGYASYSGAATPPKFGDYEAQRHWMEITIHYPASQWYMDTPDNNITYWPLDYPPLSGVQSYLHGKLVNASDPAAVALRESRGFESYRSKHLLRWTVVLSDLAVYIPASLLAAYVYGDDTGRAGHPGRSSSSSSSSHTLLVAAAMLLQPALLLIDHAHFQYNGISLGLTAAAAAAIACDLQLLGSALYCLALNHKQMSLFYAPAFFGHLLGRSLQQPTWPRKVWAVAKLGLTVIGTFALCWWPYLTSTQSVLQVLGRIFPVRRGLYEDYLANWWCVTSLAIKWKQLASNALLMRVCAAATLAAAAPSMVQQIRAPTRRGLLLALANSGYAFFMFSYQVHEKSILLPLLPVTMMAASEPEAALWGPLVAAFSMYPLLERDGAAGVYVASCALYLLLVSALVPTAGSGRAASSGRSSSSSSSTSHGHLPVWLLQAAPIVAAGLCVLCHAVRLLPPPSRLPWLWDRLHVTMAWVPITAHMLYLNWRQYHQQVPGPGQPATAAGQRPALGTPVRASPVR